MPKIQLIEVKSEIGAGTRGASLGVDAMKIAALESENSFFITHPSVSLETENHLLHRTPQHAFAKRIEGVVKMYVRISAQVKSTLANGSFPIVLSGDHSTAGGTIAGIKMANPEKRLGVIWIDAHADLHSPFTSPSGNMHGTPLAVSLDEDNRISAKNRPDDKTIEQWNALKNIGGISPKIQANDLIFMGLRSYEKEEEDIIKNKNIRFLTVDEIKEGGTDNACSKVIEYLKQVDLIYISFDVDVMDAAITRGTGTPVPGGLTKQEAEQIICRLLENKKVCCLEFTEINPILDNGNLVGENAFDILQQAAAQLDMS